MSGKQEQVSVIQADRELLKLLEDLVTPYQGPATFEGSTGARALQLVARHRVAHTPQAGPMDQARALELMAQNYEAIGAHIKSKRAAMEKRAREVRAGILSPDEYDTLKLMLAFRSEPRIDREAVELLRKVRACRTPPRKGQSIHGPYEVGEGWSISGLCKLLPEIDALLNGDQ